MMRNSTLLIPFLISVFSIAAKLFSQPPTNLRPKIFVIGLSKTGTTSVGNALALLGYKRIGWKDVRSRHLVHTYLHGNIAPLVEQTHYFDAFEDLPWPFVYREMADMYPDAKFVLTLRKDEQTWLRSMHRHQSRGYWEPAVRFYGTQDIKHKGEIAAGIYRNHTADVRKYFRDQPHRYVEMVIDDDSETNWRALCRVAQSPGGRVPDIDFPRSNTVEHWREGKLAGEVHGWTLWAVARVEDLCVDLYFGRGGQFVRFLLERIWHFVSVIELACCDLYFKFAVQTQPPVPVK